jgi:hypothetical protein
VNENLASVTLVGDVVTGPTPRRLTGARAVGGEATGRSRKKILKSFFRTVAWFPFTGSCPRYSSG